MTFKEKTKVVIIGGGAAGVGAAELLHEHKIAFRLLEAQNRLGGRMKQTNFEGYIVEDGANWIHGEYDIDWNTTTSNEPLFRNPLWIWQRYYNGTNMYMGGSFTNYSKEEFKNDKGEDVDTKLEDQCWKEVEEAVDACGQKASGLWDQYCKDAIDIEEVETKDTTIRQCVHDELGYEKFSVEKKKICDVIIWEEIEFETGIFNASLMHNYPLNNINGKPFNDKDFLITEGYNIIIDTISSQFHSRFNVNERVKRIKYSDTGVEVEAEYITGGQTYRTIIEADYAICTVPLGVLQKHDITFDPPFSTEKLAAINGMKMGSYEKIYVIFPSVFWDNDDEVLLSVVDGVEAQDSIMAWGLNLNHEKYFPESKMFTFHCMGKPAHRIASQPKDDTLKEVNVLMKKLFEDAEDAKHIHVTNWTHNPNSYGSWSSMPLGYGKAQWNS